MSAAQLERAPPLLERAMPANEAGSNHVPLERAMPANGKGWNHVPFERAMPANEAGSNYARLIRGWQPLQQGGKQ